jgi:hypothetical protein
MKPVKAFTLERSTYEAIAYLPNQIRLEVYDAIMMYVFAGIDPTETLKPIARCVFCLIRPSVDFNLKQRRNASQPKRSGAQIVDPAKVLNGILGDTVMSLSLPSSETLSVEPRASQLEANSQPNASQTQARLKPDLTTIEADNPPQAVANTSPERKAEEIENKEVRNPIRWSKTSGLLGVIRNNKDSTSQLEANSQPTTIKEKEISPTPPKEKENTPPKEKNSLKRVKKESAPGEPREAAEPTNHDDAQEGELSAIEGFNQWLQEEAPYIARNFTHTLTAEELDRLKSKYSSEKIAETVLRIENRKDLRKRYTNLYRTLLNWLKNDTSKKAG